MQTCRLGPKHSGKYLHFVSSHFNDEANLILLMMRQTSFGTSLDKRHKKRDSELNTNVVRELVIKVKPLC